MNLEFKPDIFSDTLPKWRLAGAEFTNTIIEIFNSTQIEKAIFSDLLIEFSGAFEINSSNLRISFSGDKFVLKRWSHKAVPKQLEKLLQTMDWLASNNLPVPVPIKFINGNFINFCNNYYWSIFPFVEGHYFSGEGDELEALAYITGILSKTLTKLPIELLPDSGPSHLSDSDDAIIQIMESEINNWPSMFGIEYSKLLKHQWDELKANWARLRNESIYAGPVFPCHFDLHPHNILVNDGQIVALLDFESLKMFPEGYCVGFNALKQCRQAVVKSFQRKSARDIGNEYLQLLSRSNPKFESYIDKMSDLANTEVMRRLCVIFRLNVESNDKSWNHILPIQLSHLKESKQLFT